MRIEKSALLEALDEETRSTGDVLSSDIEQERRLSSALDSPSLAGAAYDALRERISLIRVPALRAHYIAVDALCAANMHNRDLVAALPETSPGVLDTDECDRLISQATMNIGLLEGEAARLSQTPFKSEYGARYESLISINQEAVKLAEEKKRSAEEYVINSASLYAEAAIACDRLSLARQSVSSYVKTGDAGDLSWTASLESLYTEAQSRYTDVMHRAASMGGSLVLSDDKQYIYYNGAMYKIAGSTADFNSSLEPGFYPSWSIVREKEYPYYSFDNREFKGFSASGIDFEPHRIDSNGDNALLKENASAKRGIQVATLGLSILDSSSKAKEMADKEGSVVFRFETNGTDNRVSILASGDLTKYAVARNTVWARLALHPNSFMASWLLGDSEHLDSNKTELYRQASGGEPNGDLHFDATFAERDDNSFTGRYAYDENGELVEFINL